MRPYEIGVGAAIGRPKYASNSADAHCAPLHFGVGANIVRSLDYGFVYIGNYMGGGRLADLGNRYASALFEISAERGLISEYLEQAQFLRDALHDGDAMRILTHPRISAAEKHAFLENVFGASIDENFMGFMKLAVDKHREAFLLPALDALVYMIKKHRNQTTAKVVSAVPLTDAQAAQLTGVLEKKLGKQVELTVLVDESVIAGISIHADGYFFDRTVKTMLKDLRDSCKKTAPPVKV